MQTTITKEKTPNTMEKDSKKLYEFYIVLSPTEANEEGAEEHLLKAIEQQGGEIKSKDRLSKSELAYPMQNKQFAYRGSIYFYIEPEKIQNLEEEIKSSDIEIMRWMIIAAKDKKVRKVRKSPEFEKDLEKELEVVEKAASEPKEKKEETKKGKAKTEEAEDEPKKKSKKDDGDSKESTSSIEDIDKKLDEIMGDL